MKQIYEGSTYLLSCEDFYKGFWHVMLHLFWKIMPFEQTPYREVAYAHRILEEPLETGGPAGHSLLWDPSVAAPSWKTAIAVQAALAAASLQLDSAVICKASSMHSG